jgi:hypothetical protein
MKVDLLIGVERDTVDRFGLDRATPWLAGALSHDMLEILPREDEDKLWREMKETVAAEPDMYTWRQITIDLDDDQIRKHFAGPTITGQVDEPEGEATV